MGGTFDGPHASDEASTGPVPRVCMDYFYVSSTSAGPIVGAQGMSTRELRHRLKELGKSTMGGAKRVGEEVPDVRPGGGP